MLQKAMGEMLHLQGSCGENMNIDQILNELRNERDRLTRAIEALESTKSTRSAVRRAGGIRGRRKNRLTPEGRRRLSQMMKRRWAERRKKAA